MSRPGSRISVMLQRLILPLAVLLQLLLLATTTALPLAKGVLEVREGAARHRGVRLAFGDSFAGYIEFINEVVPTDALVVIPPAEHDASFGHMGLMQAMLFPRRLTNCPSVDHWAECAVNYGGANTYLLSVDGFPPPMESKRYIEFDGRRGLFVPPGAIP